MPYFKGTPQQIEAIHQEILRHPNRSYFPMRLNLKHDGRNGPHSQLGAGATSAIYALVYDIYLDEKAKGDYSQWGNWLDFWRWFNTETVDIRFNFNHRDGFAEIKLSNYSYSRLVGTRYGKGIMPELNNMLKELKCQSSFSTSAAVTEDSKKSPTTACIKPVSY